MSPVPRTYRPRFVLWAALVRQLPLQLFLTVWAGAFLGGFSAVAGAVLASGPGGGAGRALLAGPALFGTAAFVLVPLVTVGAKAANYRRTRYLLGPRELDVEEGFWTVQGKRLALADVTEVTLRRGALQRLCGLGSVYLATRTQGGPWGWRGSALLGGTSLSGSGAMLMDIPEWAEVYAELRARVGAGR